MLQVFHLIRDLAIVIGSLRAKCYARERLFLLYRHYPVRNCNSSSGFPASELNSFESWHWINLSGQTGLWTWCKILSSLGLTGWKEVGKESGGAGCRDLPFHVHCGGAGEQCLPLTLPLKCNAVLPLSWADRTANVRKTKIYYVRYNPWSFRCSPSRLWKEPAWWFPGAFSGDHHRRATSPLSAFSSAFLVVVTVLTSWKTFALVIGLLGKTDLWHHSEMPALCMDPVPAIFSCHPICQWGKVSTVYRMLSGPCTCSILQGTAGHFHFLLE